MPEMHHQPAFGSAHLRGGYGGLGYPGMQPTSNSFPSLASRDRGDMSHVAPPAINVDFASNNAKQGPYEQVKSHIDQDSLDLPDRGMRLSLFSSRGCATHYSS